MVEVRKRSRDMVSDGAVTSEAHRCWTQIRSRAMCLPSGRPDPAPRNLLVQSGSCPQCGFLSPTTALGTALFAPRRWTSTLQALPQCISLILIAKPFGVMWPASSSLEYRSTRSKIPIMGYNAVVEGLIPYVCITDRAVAW